MGGKNLREQSFVRHAAHQHAQARVPFDAHEAPLRVHIVKKARVRVEGQAQNLLAQRLGALQPHGFLPGAAEQASHLRQSHAP